MNRIIFGESLEVLKALPERKYSLIYIDPPFNTGGLQRKVTLEAVRSKNGRAGFGGHLYETKAVATLEYSDRHDDYLGFIELRLRLAKEKLTANGSLFFHIDYREAHYCKVLLDEIFGRESFMNEIIWAYDFGGRSKKRWPCKHDNIFWYALNPDDYIFNYEEIERIPYMAPNLVGAEKAARGKTPTDVWWQTIVSTNGKEKTGYPNQKPLALIERIVRVHSNKGDEALDFFAGSGTLAEAAAKNGRFFTVCDNNPDAIKVIASRMSEIGITCEAESF